MKRIIALGGCHITDGDRNKVFNTSGIFVNKKIPYQLSNKSNKSIYLLEHYLESFKKDEILIIMQIGNIEFTNAIRNLINYKIVKKIWRYTHSKATTTEICFKQKPQHTFLKVLKIAFYILIIPLNVISASFLYVHKIYKLKTVFKKHSNIDQVILITPFYCFLNFNWIIRKYCILIYRFVFKHDRLFNIINAYDYTKDKKLILSDGFHLNNQGLQILGEIVLTEVEKRQFADKMHNYNVAL